MLSPLFLATVIGVLAYVLTKIVAARRFMFRLQNAGLPMPPYNTIFGHFLVLGKYMKKLPADVTTNTTFYEIAKEFPGGIFYLDLWPVAKPVLVLNTITTANQLAHAQLEKPKNIEHAFQDLTGGPNLFTMPHEPWKYWRALFNPGFSASYMTTLATAIVRETDVFCDLLRRRAGASDVFQLENLTLKLTIDVIGAVTVDERWLSQVQEHPLAAALRTQIEWTSFGSEINPLSRLNPLRRPLLWYNGRRVDRLSTVIAS
ncbi:cytochrome P450 [Amniculicola lignicola CBS 123094]|uniref:Cytochrome P450 n=1 Tax=Amniculicola lignicola CBS 123094 TaxID=1392246 RepID=A0A6A5VY38_9PLEO|nr:cytochrome P450 [Amniculicola lignicola CBS 123094]